MALIRLPLRGDMSRAAAERLHDTLLDQHRIEVPIIWLPGWSSLWVRISAQVYNSMADYEQLRDAVLAMARDEGAHDS